MELAVNAKGRVKESIVRDRIFLRAHFLIIIRDYPINPRLLNEKGRRYLIDLFHCLLRFRRPRFFF
jgi:hypothetical protein